MKEGGGGEGERERGNVHWGCCYDTSLDIEVDPQHSDFGSRESDFALQGLVECRERTECVYYCRAYYKVVRVGGGG